MQNTLTALAPRLNASQWLTQAQASVHAACRTLTYALGYRAMGLGERPRTAAQKNTARRQLREAYELQKAMLARPGMRDLLRRAEAEDLAQLPAFLACLPFDIARARKLRNKTRAPRAVVPRDGFDYPEYYLHDFHYQANGALSWRAAMTYEWQIRFLFAGTNRLMRQVVIDALPAGKYLRILDVGCGTASWVTQARLSGRDHPVVGVDLSPDYLAVARGAKAPDASFSQHNAETLPEAWNEQFDVVTCIWMYHELPLAAQQRVTASIARVLKPGGKFLLMDAAQQVDVPEDDITHGNVLFATHFNEPHFMAYQNLDFTRLLHGEGLHVRRTQRIFVSKLIEATKA